jgi:hypothetical protein
MTVGMTDPTSATITQLNQQSEKVRDSLRTQSEAFWDFQDHLLNQMERMSRAWFLRRHEGTHAALKAACGMCVSATPMDAMQEYMGWASGCVERLTRDALDAQTHAASLSELVLGATHRVMGGASEAGKADIMTPTEADRQMPMKTAA